MASVIRVGESVTRAQTSFARDYGPGAEGLSSFRMDVRADSTQTLSALIESEIIPRLMVAHAGDHSSVRVVDGDAAIDLAEVEMLVPLALQVEADTLLNHVEAILARGVAVDTIMVDLLAPAARLLGEYWEEDRCDFVDVTMGLWRLQEIVHEIASRVSTDGVRTASGRRALFASMPGDQHSFGTVVIDELFRREGWITERMSDAETSDLIKRTAENWFDMIGLTISCDCNIPKVRSMIVTLRSVSRNPRVCVMVGGRICSADPEFAVQVGADGTARDAKLALRVADKLLRTREGEVAECN